MSKVEGKLLKNKYKIERKIAEGGMSTIYSCRNIELDNKWIVKHIDKKYDHNIYEEDILKKLYHISLPKIVDVCRDENGIYIIQSYIEGIPLIKLIRNTGALEIDRIIDYALQLCEVLQYLHNMKPRPIIHKDLKPSNIIVTENDKLVLIDFGIAQELGGRQRIVRAATNIYAPPEQLALDGICDTRGDIYSLGIILVQLAAGEATVRTYETKNKKAAGVRRRLLDIGEKCSAFFPEDRYQRVEEVMRDLIEARNALIADRESRKKRRKWAVTAVVLISLLDYIASIIGLIIY